MDVKMDEADFFQYARHSLMLLLPCPTCLEDPLRGKMMGHSGRGQDQAKIPDQA